MTAILSLVFQFIIILNGYYISKHARSSNKKIEIQLILPDKSTQIASYPCLNIDALIINHTDTVVSFFEDWNAWGYYNIRFEVKLNDSTYVLRKKERDWPKNFPSFKVLFPGDTLKLSFGKKYFGCEFAQVADMFSPLRNSNTSIKAIYQTNPLALSDVMKKRDIDSSVMVKYNYKWVPRDPKRPAGNGDWVISDSISRPVPLYQTFTLAQIESKEYNIY